MEWRTRQTSGHSNVEYSESYEGQRSSEMKTAIKAWGGIVQRMTVTAMMYSNRELSNAIPLLTD